MHAGTPLNLELAVATHVGGRAENQDACAHHPAGNGAFLVVCDGMGGHSGGGLAARFFTDAMGRAAGRDGIVAPGAPPEAVARAVRAAAADMGARVRALDPSFDPHTTTVMAWAGPHRTVVAHVGDSRLYHLTADGVRWRTRDHSVVQDLVDNGTLRPDQALHHPYRNLVLRSVAGDAPPEPEIAVLDPLGPGEALLLCSDGFWEHVGEDEMAALVAADGSLEASLAGLVERAVARGGPRADNTTALVARRGA